MKGLDDGCACRSRRPVDRRRQKGQEIVDMNDVCADGQRPVGDRLCSRAGPYGLNRQADLLGSRRLIRYLVVVDDQALDSMAVLGEQIGFGVEDGIFTTGLPIAVMDDQDGFDRAGCAGKGGSAIRRDQFDELGSADEGAGERPPTSTPPGEPMPLKRRTTIARAMTSARATRSGLIADAIRHRMEYGSP